ncbi:hypothetical protein LTR62_000065 [Meristemomyces frigidus]|uniref:SET domain-containing protein n=1 Tax=Meristemomyces frigidus TaxID=1508187 RepID=A0AAN7YUL6_9PEZI|nr:hypothetical protein LTR62_000065 [Meristemomyces frigidus]
MAASDAGNALGTWHKQHGGYLHPSISIAYTIEAGYHWHATSPIPPNTTISVAPHTLTLSYLNALVDPAFPVFRHNREAFKVEAIGFFYLMSQYVHRSFSFWKAYIDALPQPNVEFCTPLWFDNPEDIVWLEDTDVLHTMLGRREVYEEYYASGVRMLKQAGVDTELYTWDLFRWAVTIFTSRSFSSRALTPQESKYWTTHKTNPDGQRQTVLLDMSHTPAEDLDFPVLFPVQDIGNHRNEARVDWSYDPGRFGITINDDIAVGEEVFNNYGPKTNDELFLGYGFCIPDNPYDGVLLTLKPPPAALQKEMQLTHPGYFTMAGNWSSERTTFRLRNLKPSDDVFRVLPAPLLELLLYIVLHERGLPFVFIQDARDNVLRGAGRRYTPHIARMIVLSLAPKLHKLQSTTPEKELRNQKQRQAAIYRHGQIATLEANISALKYLTRSLLSPPTQAGPRLVTLEGLLEIWCARNEARVNDFLQGIESITGTSDIGACRDAGWEDDILVLALCSIALDGLVVMPEYISRNHRTAEHNQETTELPNTAVVDGEALARAREAMQLVERCAAGSDVGSLWRDRRWCAEFVAGIGGKWVEFDSFMMMVPRDQGEEEARLVVYLHGLL